MRLISIRDISQFTAEIKSPLSNQAIVPSFQDVFLKSRPTLAAARRRRPRGRGLARHDNLGVEGGVVEVLFRPQEIIFEVVRGRVEQENPED